MVYNNPLANGDDFPVQIEWDRFTLDGSEPAIYVAGNSDGFNQGSSSSTGRDFVILKYKASNGAVWNSAWTQPFRYNGLLSGNDTLAEMAFRHGNCIQSQGEGEGTPSPSSFYSVLYAGGTSLESVTNKNDFTVVQVDPLDPAVFQARSDDSPGHAADTLNSLSSSVSAVVGSEGCQLVGVVAVTGFSSGMGTDTNDFVTRAYSPTISPSTPPIWTSVFDGEDEIWTVGSDQAVCVVATSFAVFVTGESWRVGNQGYDIATLGYDAFGGSILWTTLPGGVDLFNNPTGNAEDRPSDMVVDKASNVYVAGRSYNGTSLDYVAIRYDSGGTRNWVECVGGVPTANDFVLYNGPQNSTDYAAGIRVSLSGGQIDLDGDVFMYGIVTNTGNKYRLTKHVQSTFGCPP